MRSKVVKGWFASVYMALFLGLTTIGMMVILGSWHGGWQFLWPGLIAFAVLLGAYFLVPEVARMMDADAEPPPAPKAPRYQRVIRYVLRCVVTTAMLVGFQVMVGKTAMPFYQGLAVVLVLNAALDTVILASVALGRLLRLLATNRG